MRKILSLLLVVALALSVSAVAGAAEPAKEVMKEAEAAKTSATDNGAKQESPGGAAEPAKKESAPATPAAAPAEKK